MAKSPILRTAGAAAVAAGIAFAALPGAAFAQDDDSLRHHGHDQRPSEGRGDGPQRDQTQAPAQAQAQASPNAQAQRNRGDFNPAQQQRAIAARQGQVAAREGQVAAREDQVAARQGQVAAQQRQVAEQQRDVRQRQLGQQPPYRGGQQQGLNGDRRSPNGYDGRHDGYDGRRDGYGHTGDNRYAHDQRRWDRDWRGSQRYDWRGYRDNHRDLFRVGRYSSPYRGWSYRRLSVGFYLQPLFFGHNYWISDPYYYRLPPAYAPYQWVRYYDDALLVDTYTGEVVDTIYGIFG